MHNGYILRPINYGFAKKNIPDLDQIPHLRACEIALLLIDTEGGQETPMYKTGIKMSKKREKDILMKALERTSELYPPRLYTAEELLLTAGSDRAPEPCRLTKDGIPKSEAGYVLTTDHFVYGSAAAFYPGVLRQIADALGEDIVLAFTSIHEVQIHPASQYRLDLVKDSLRDTNRHCNRKEEVLSDLLYRYNRESAEFGIYFTDGKFFDTPLKVGK